MKIGFFMALAATLFFASCGHQSSEKMNNTAYENIMTRTSIRQYTDQPLSEAQIDSLLKAGMAAPTAVNKQPWELVVIQSPETKQALTDNFSSYRMAANAPLVIAVLGNMNNALEGEAQGYWVEDCSAAMENILLAAHSMGLGAVWCGVYPIEERVKKLSELLQLPEHVTTLGIACIGYPAENPEPKNKWNPDKVHWEKW